MNSRKDAICDRPTLKEVFEVTVAGNVPSDDYRLFAAWRGG